MFQTSLFAADDAGPERFDRAAGDHGFNRRSRGLRLHHAGLQSRDERLKRGVGDASGFLHI